MYIMINSSYPPAMKRQSS